MYEKKTKKSTSARQYDLIIVGGGSAAFSAAIKASELNKSVLMINFRLPIGGTCVNVGCVPSKNLIRAGETLHKANNNRFPGIETNGSVTDFKKLIVQKRDLISDLRTEKYINVAKDLDGFEQINGRAIIVSPNSVKVNNNIYYSEYILLAMGAKPAIPDIEGINNVPYLDNESAFELEEIPESVTVIGGRYVALETAQMFSRLGSKVTVLQRSSRILPSESPELTEELTGYFIEEGIDVLTENNIKRVREEKGKIIVETVVKGEKKTIISGKIIVATGRTPNTGNIGLEEVGVELDTKGFVKTDEFLQTSVHSILAAGDVIGKNMFVYSAAYEGNLSVSNIFTKDRKKRDYTALPWVVFTDPQVAGIGMDERDAERNGIDFDISVLPLTHVPRAIAARDTRGFIKMIRNKKEDTLIGARILASEGSELLMEAALAIKFGIKVSDIKEMFHPYLTLSEGVKLAMIGFDKDVSTLSCCAN